MGKHERLLADVNGDHRQDIVAFGDDGVWLALANADGTYAAPTLVLANFGSKQGWDAAKHVRVMGDINGDGKDDIVAFGDAGVWIALSTGTGFLAPRLSIGDLGYNQGWRTDKHVRLLADVNGDGMRDIVAFGDAGVWLALANPNGFGPVTFVLQDFGVQQSWSPAKHVRLLSDIDGDGKADIVGFGDDGVYTALSTGSGFAPAVLVLGDFTNGGIMDAVLSNDFMDDNGFPRNPVWRRLSPYPCGPCPCGNGVTTPRNWNETPGCSVQSLHTNTHSGLGDASYSGIACAAGGATGLNGQMNWFPVEYEGTLTWGGHSNPVYDDDDYYFTLSRPDAALQTYGRDGVHFEFDSEETVDHWDDTNTWWNDFHHNAVDKNDQTAKSYVNGRQAIVIGMLALDLEHADTHSELHPAYAVFVRMPGANANQEKIAFFVRNWGDGGFCGPNQEYIKQDKLYVRLRHPRGSTSNLGQNVSVWGDQPGDAYAQRWSYDWVRDGVLLTFNLQDASKHCGFVGDLTIDWGAPQTAVTTVMPKTPEFESDEDGDVQTKAKFEKLSKSDQRALLAQIFLKPQHTPTKRIQGTIGGTVPPAAPGRAKTAPNGGQGLSSTVDSARLRQKLTKHQAVLDFLKAHGAP